VKSKPHYSGDCLLRYALTGSPGSQAGLGIELSRKQCEAYDATKYAGGNLGKRWQILFHDARKRFPKKRQTFRSPAEPINCAQWRG